MQHSEYRARFTLENDAKVVMSNTANIATSEKISQHHSVRCVEMVTSQKGDHMPLYCGGASKEGLAKTVDFFTRDSHKKV